MLRRVTSRKFLDFSQVLTASVIEGLHEVISQKCIIFFLNLNSFSLLRAVVEIVTRSSYNLATGIGNVSVNSVLFFFLSLFFMIYELKLIFVKKVA
jgi:predicted PurR-regulated permease PerM